MAKPIRTVMVVPSLPAQLEPLRHLAYNLRWSWDHESFELFHRLDPELWEASGHNPVRMLGAIAQERLDEAASNAGFLAQTERAARRLDEYMVGLPDCWYSQHHGTPGCPLVAFFSAEFGLTECLPLYSGGLGVLSGDYLKSCSDLGVPLVGVGINYQKGYFRQFLNVDGWQAESYPLNDFYTMPMGLERDAEGNQIMIEVPFPERTVKARIWRVQVGRVPLFLMDANVPENSPADREITNQLYGGDGEMRIKQEIMLGIGGVRALEALGIEPTVYHMNEGHSAFSGLERIRLLMQRHDQSFAAARLAAMAGGLFTTHTPVSAGIDRFDAELIDRYLGAYVDWLGISREEFFALGRIDAHNWQEPFNMAVLAFRLSAWHNGVSQLHGVTSRTMWKGLWPEVPDDEVPIQAITNGVHIPSILSPDMAALYDRYMGPQWREDQADGARWELMERVPAEEMWRTHERRRERLVATVRSRLAAQLERHGAPQKLRNEAIEVLDPDALTIGFARRFATYKRALLLLRDPERLAAILGDKDRPVQIIFAGKAHPADGPGKELIRDLVHASGQEGFRRRLVFLEDYDLNLARYLIAGVDVWLNTPRRPREASGTSGMKAAANGVLNLSILDGWWNEAYDKDVGWAIGSGEVYHDLEYQDQVESQALYSLLEKEVVPLFYDRGPDGLPRGWITRMRASIARLTPVYNTHRMVKEYVARMYRPAHEGFTGMAGDEMHRAATLSGWLEHISRRWGQIWVRHVKAGQHDQQVAVGDQIDVSVEVFLGEISPEDVDVELYYGRLDPDRGITAPMTSTMAHHDRRGTGMHAYTGTVTCTTSGQFGYTVRVLPRHPHLPDRLLPALICWAGPDLT